MAQRKRYVFVCVNRRPDGTPKGSCAVRGSEELLVHLKARLKERKLADVEVRACSSSCLDACWVGPCVAVEPDHYFYGRVQPGDIEEIIDAWEQGSRVERLVLSEADFVLPKELKRLEDEAKLQKGKA
ncbi:MAG: (2Fe-2S) ferredoxin domain-containing protein [Polyangiaceae bacterium]|nr:(2Fe-2S) ferredoxin domain-containing protein [Polyangiaceae bacterium]